MHKANLILHCGARAATHEQIASTATPALTATWVPIAHDRLLTGVRACLERAGLSVVSEAHGLARDGNRYFGLLQVAGPATDPNDFGLAVGLPNSRDQTFPAGLVAGASVFV